MKALYSTGLRWLWLMVLVIIADFASKQWVINHLQLHMMQPVMPFFNLFYTRNYGAAFSFLAGFGGWQRWFFVVIALIIVLVLLVLMYRNAAQRRLPNVAYALVAGGALGNLFDRLYHGFVVDMIDFYIGNWHFATFNLADCGITVGAALIVWESLFHSASGQVHPKH